MKNSVNRLSVVPKWADWIRPGVAAQNAEVKSEKFKLKNLREIKNTNSTVKVDDNALQNRSQKIAWGKVNMEEWLLDRKLSNRPLKNARYKGNCP